MRTLISLLFVLFLVGSADAQNFRWHSHSRSAGYGWRSYPSRTMWQHGMVYPQQHQRRVIYPQQRQIVQRSQCPCGRDCDCTPSNGCGCQHGRRQLQQQRVGQPLGEQVQVPVEGSPNARTDRRGEPIPQPVGGPIVERGDESPMVIQPVVDESPSTYPETEERPLTEAELDAMPWEDYFKQDAAWWNRNFGTPDNPRFPDSDGGGEIIQEDYDHQGNVVRRFVVPQQQRQRQTIQRQPQHLVPR